MAYHLPRECAENIRALPTRQHPGGGGIGFSWRFGHPQCRRAGLGRGRTLTGWPRQAAASCRDITKTKPWGQNLGRDMASGRTSVRPLPVLQARLLLLRGGLGAAAAAL